MTETAPPATPPDIATDEQGRLAADLPCVQCQYNLRTLPTTATCPECGEPVQNTMRAASDLSAYDEWLSQPLARGAISMLASQACFFVAVLFAWALYSGLGEVGSTCSMLAGLLLMGIAVVALATPAPPGTRYGWSRGWQQIVVGLASIAAFAFIVALVAQLDGSAPGAGAIITGVAFGVGLFGSLSLVLIHGMRVAWLLGWRRLGWCCVLLALPVMLMGVMWVAGLLGAIEYLAIAAGYSEWRAFEMFGRLFATTALAVFVAAIPLLITFLIAFRKARVTGKIVQRSAVRWTV